PPGTSPSTSPSVRDAGLLANAGAYNTIPAPGTGEFGLDNPIGAAPRTKSFLATLHRQMTPWLDAFVEFQYAGNASTSIFNPYQFPSRAGAYVNSSAPTNPFNQDVVVTLPSTLSTPLITHSVTRSITAGFTAKLPRNWTGEADYTQSKNSFDYFEDQT